MRKFFQVWIPILFVAFATVAASAQSFRVQCPTNTITHPFHAASGVDCSKTPTAPGCNNDEPQYNGPTTFGTVTVNGTTGGHVTPTANVNWGRRSTGYIRCWFVKECKDGQCEIFALAQRSSSGDEVSIDQVVVL